MTTEPTAEQRARLAKLGQRDRSASPSVDAIARASTPWSPPTGTPVTVGQIVVDPATATSSVVDRHTSVRLFGSRRRHVAAAGRILATGLATSGFLATIASLAIADARTVEANQADAATPTTTDGTVHRVVNVDESGNPTAPRTTLGEVATSAATTIATVVDSPTATTVGTLAPSASTPPTKAVPATPVSAATPKPAPEVAPAAAPAVEPAPTVAPAPTAAPAPAPTPAPAPAPTAAPVPTPTAPPATAPPATAPPTTAPAPAPAPPPCQGSGC